MTVSSVTALPVLPLRDIVVFPHMIVPLFVGREKSIKALEAVMAEDKQIILATQTDAGIEDPDGDGLYTTGTVGSILQLLKLPDGAVKVLVEGGERLRFELVDFTSQTDIDVSLPRTSTAIITAPMPAHATDLRFGWDARLGDLILRQMADPSIDPKNLYTGLLNNGSQSPAISPRGVAAQPVSAVIINYI